MTGPVKRQNHPDGPIRHAQHVVDDLKRTHHTEARDA